VIRRGTERWLPAIPNPEAEVVMIMVWTYGIYLAISVALTIWVGRTLYKNGRVFLIDALGGNAGLADSVNHLLLVGFYLINAGFVALALKYGDPVHEVQSAIEYLSTKIGIVLLVLGAMHFFNLFVLSRWRRRALRQTLPPELPDDRRPPRDHGVLRALRTPADEYGARR
jgi:hypothetical protein